tara:strand:+ start:47 stop:250 length:204 start_codon:yes stop_codon:yes gene_type:complete
MLDWSPIIGDLMQLVKHFERGYGHAEKTISPDGRAGYLVRFFDRYNNPVIFTATSVTKKILDFVEEE